MKWLFFFTIIILASCKFSRSEDVPVADDTKNKPSTAKVVEPAAVVDTGNADTTDYVDSFRLVVDSLLKTDIKLPPIYYHDIVCSNDSSVSKFSMLSKATNGKMRILVNSNLVAKELMSTIDGAAKPQSDLLLLIDKTGSMYQDIAIIRQGLAQILDTIKKFKGVRLAVAFYGDKNVDYTWYNFKNFETKYDDAQQMINEVEVKGGGDWPESVYDAVMKSMDQDFWQSKVKRNIIIIGDAPPLEKPRSQYTLQEVIARAKQDKLIMNFYPIIITPTAQAAKLEPEELVSYQPAKMVSLLYPNPCKGTVNIGFEDCGEYYIEIFDAAGSEVVSESVFGLHWTKDLGDIKNGVYIARVINKIHKYEVVKFVLNRNFR